MKVQSLFRGTGAAVQDGRLFLPATFKSVTRGPGLR
jgi:hypothetical protein